MFLGCAVTTQRTDTLPTGDLRYLHSSGIHTSVTSHPFLSHPTSPPHLNHPTSPRLIVTSRYVLVTDTDRLSTLLAIRLSFDLLKYSTKQAMNAMLHSPSPRVAQILFTLFIVLLLIKWEGRKTQYVCLCLCLCPSLCLSKGFLSVLRQISILIL